MNLKAERDFWNTAAVEQDIRDLIYRGSEKDPAVFESSGAMHARQVAQHTNIDKDSIVLDIGSGIGRVAKHVAGMCREVHCVDISKVMCREGRKHCCGMNVHFHVVDGKTLQPLCDNFFDAAYSFLTFQHMQKPRVFCYLVEMARVLKLGGRFLIQVPSIEYKELIDGYRRWVEYDEIGPNYMRVYSTDEILAYCRHARLNAKIAWTKDYIMVEGEAP